jgi:hypothetical protein
MPTTVRCPNCDETFQMDDEGGRAECPACGLRFEAPRRRLTLGPSDDPSAPALEAGAVAVLLRGTLLQSFAHGLYLLGLLLMMVLMLRELDRGTGGPVSDKVTRLLAVVLALSLVVSWVLNVVAGACWAMAATKGVSRPLGVAVLALGLLVLSRSGELLYALSGSPFGRGAPFDDVPLRAYGPAVLLTTYYLDVARVVVLAAYLASAARDTGRSSVRGPALILAVVTPVFLLGPVGLMMLAGLVDRVADDLTLVLLLLMMAGAVVSVIWGLITVLQLRGAWQRILLLGRE